MNIGIDSRALMDPIRTGVGEYAYELLSALFKLDRENQYFLFYNSFTDVSQDIPQWQQENIHYVSTKWPNKLFNTGLLIRKRPFIDSLISKKQCNNLDYFFSPNLNFTSVSPNTKFILTIHDLSFKFFKDYYSWKQRVWHRLIRPKQQCSRANIILTPSENTRRDVVEHLNVAEAKVRCLYPGIPERFKEQETNNPLPFRYGRASKEPIIQKYNLPERFILFLGTIEPRKNIVGIIEAYKLSSLIFNHCSLVIAGVKGWKDKDIMKLIKQTPGVHYVGYVAQEDKPNLYRLAQVFVYPSLYEGFGFPVLEAMASGVPVVTSSRSSLPEVTGGSAYLVNPYNITEIAEGMKLLATNEAVRQFHIVRGLEQAKQFAWGKCAKEFLSLLKLA